MLLPFTYKPVFSPHIPRSSGFAKFVELSAYLQASIEPIVHHQEREFCKLGEPVGADPRGINKLIFATIDNVFSARTQWTRVVEDLGTDYRMAYGFFTAEEEKVYEENLKITKTLTPVCRAYFAKLQEEREDSEDEFFDAVETQ